MARLIQQKDIPKSIWRDNTKTLHLPPLLVEAWTSLLDKYELRERATSPSPTGTIGGMGKKDTDDYLAWKFTGASARVVLSVVDPKEELAATADAFARIFAGNTVFLADLPCGSGAASMSILATLAELRAQGRVPRIPLEVVILGGDISEYACAYATEGLDSLKSELEKQAITIEFIATDWDVCSADSNTEFIKQSTLKSHRCSARLLMLSNFAGFLQGEGKWKDAQKQFDELFRHSRDSLSTAIWIEPDMNTVTSQGGFMDRLLKFVKKQVTVISSTTSEPTSKEAYATSSADVKHPLKDRFFKVKLAVARLDLPLVRNK